MYCVSHHGDSLVEDSSEGSSDDDSEDNSHIWLCLELRERMIVLRLFCPDNLSGTHLQSPLKVNLAGPTSLGLYRILIVFFGGKLSETSKE